MGSIWSTWELLFRNFPSRINNNNATLTRTIKVIFLSQFLRFNPAFQKVFHASCTRIRATARQQTSAPGLKSGSDVALYRDRCASAHLLKSCTGIQKWPPSKFVPRSRQHVINLVPWRQKLRHASLPTALETWVLKTINPALPPLQSGTSLKLPTGQFLNARSWSAQHQKRTFIAGPLYLSHFATVREILTPQWPKYNALSMD